MKQLVTNMMQGLSMALADSVPGVSGGTIAFILGFYEKFIGALHGIIGKDPQVRKESAIYLIKFAAGWAIGMGACVLILTRMFDSHIYFLSSLFLGFSVAAIPFILYEERDTMKNRYGCLTFTVLGIAAVAALTWVRSTGVIPAFVDLQNASLLQYGYLFLAGAIAVSAMLLPGISGSTFLLILGVYVPVISGVKEVLHLHLQYLPGIFALALGVLCGIVFAAKAIQKAFRSFRPQMMYLVIGLVAGSLYAIAMGPTTLDVPKPPMDITSFNVFAFAVGIVVLAGLELIRNRTLFLRKEN